ncbi:MAG TPA: LicD family protein [Alphaproteobacteria bacterium]|nr:LicD family protein [Alphaproteobacteria bacterium]
MTRVFFRILALFCPIRSLRQKIRDLGLDPNIEAVKVGFDIIRATADISAVPPARGYMKLIQQTNLKLLVAFDKLCKENKIQYFMIGGSIIGKIRHNGFIPWDDDIDVGILEKDWYKLVDVIKKHLPNEDFDVSFGYWWNLLKIVHKRTGLFIDIFRFNRLSCEVDYEKNYNDLLDRKSLFREVYGKNHIAVDTKDSITLTSSDSEQSKEEKWSKIFGYVKAHEQEFDRVVMKNEKPKENAGIVHFSGISKPNEFFNNDIIMPIKYIEFEGVKLPFPNKIEDYAFLVWGDIWEFPTKFRNHGEMVTDINKYFVMKSVLDLSDNDLYKKLING